MTRSASRSPTAAVVEGSHCLLAVGSIPNTARLGLDEAGVELDEGGFVVVDRVSRTTARGVYAAGDCTGVLMLASVAAMQGRIAMWHALGDAVTPLDLQDRLVERLHRPGDRDRRLEPAGRRRRRDRGARRHAAVVAETLGPRCKGVQDGFVKLFCRPGTGIVVGGVVVAPRASELIHAVSVAVEGRLTVDDLAHAFTVYPSMSGSVAEAARQLHRTQ